MKHRVVVQADLGAKYISVDGVPLKYLWNDHIKHLKDTKSTKCFADIDPEDLSIMYLILENRSVRVDAMGNLNAKNCILVVEEDFWHAEWGRFHRHGKRYKNYNMNQKQIRVVTPVIFNISLWK